jgi:tyrosine phenol-lyase
VLAVYEQREKAQGLKMIYEPKYLRFFQARFERITS